MATTIKVTPQELTNASSKITGLANEYKTDYENLFKDVDAMKSNWDGQDNQAFTSQIAGFKDDFEKMFNLMIQYAQYLKTTAKSYSDAQETIKNSASKLVN